MEVCRRSVGRGIDIVVRGGGVISLRWYPLLVSNKPSGIRGPCEGCWRKVVRLTRCDVLQGFLQRNSYGEIGLGISNHNLRTSLHLYCGELIVWEI